jgi:hypothetical protein
MELEAIARIILALAAATALAGIGAGIQDIWSSRSRKRSK